MELNKNKLLITNTKRHVVVFFVSFLLSVLCVVIVTCFRMPSSAERELADIVTELNTSIKNKDVAALSEILDKEIVVNTHSEDVVLSSKDLINRWCTDQLAIDSITSDGIEVDISDDDAIVSLWQTENLHFPETHEQISVSANYTYYFRKLNGWKLRRIVRRTGV